MTSEPATLTILMLGGAKRLTMARHLISAIAARGIFPRLLSYELSAEEPIADVAEIIIGRRWADPSLIDHLTEVVSQYDVKIVIPFVDGAIEPAARLAELCPGLFCPVSTPALSAALFDKVTADVLFSRAAIPVPATFIAGSKPALPLIAKPRRGSASKGIIIINTTDELSAIEHPDDYLIQEYIPGAEEVSVDCYISRSGRILTISPRRRLMTLGGEVTRTVTIDRPDIVSASIRVIESLGLRGAATLQYLLSPRGPLLMEINPRLGGGATATIAAGADIAAMIVDEALGLEPPPESPRPDVLTVRCFHDVSFNLKPSLD